MPKGPNGQKRPADVIGTAIMVAKIATGEEEDITTEDGKGPSIKRPLPTNDSKTGLLKRQRKLPQTNFSG